MKTNLQDYPPLTGPNGREIRYSLCKCGAITLHTQYGQLSCRKDNLKKFFPGLNLDDCFQEPNCYACNHCINHMGLDLCACGSGETPDDCTMETSVCSNPYTQLPLHNGYYAAKQQETSLSSLIDQYHALQDQLKKQMNLMLHQLEQTIRMTSLPGVKQIGPTSALVSYETILRTEGHILSAQYYLPGVQADLVLEKLQHKLDNPPAMLEEINQMIRTRSVRIQQITYPLNQQTIQMLQQAIHA